MTPQTSTPARPRRTANPKVYTLDPQAALDLQEGDEVDLEKFTDDLISQSPMTKEMGQDKARRLFRAMFETESNNDPNVRDSQKGARGMEQVMDSLAQEYGLDRNDPVQRRFIAIDYLSRGWKYASRYTEDPIERAGVAVSFYHGGEGALKNLIKQNGLLSRTSDGGITTNDHVMKVLGEWDRLEGEALGEMSGEETDDSNYIMKGDEPVLKMEGTHDSTIPISKMEGTDSPLVASPLTPEEVRMRKETNRGIQVRDLWLKADNPNAYPDAQQLTSLIRRTFPVEKRAAFDRALLAYYEEGVETWAHTSPEAVARHSKITKDEQGNDQLLVNAVVYPDFDKVVDTFYSQGDEAGREMIRANKAQQEAEEEARVLEHNKRLLRLKTLMELGGAFTNIPNLRFEIDKYKNSDSKLASTYAATLNTIQSGWEELAAGGVDIAASMMSRFGFGSVEGALNDLSSDIRDIRAIETAQVEENYARTGARDYSLGAITSTGEGLTGYVGFKKGDLLFDLKPFAIGRSIGEGLAQAGEMVAAGMLGGPGGLYYHSLYKGLLQGKDIGRAGGEALLAGTLAEVAPLMNSLPARLRPIATSQLFSAPTTFADYRSRRAQWESLSPEQRKGMVEPTFNWDMYIRDSVSGAILNITDVLPKGSEKLLHLNLPNDSTAIALYKTNTYVHEMMRQAARQRALPQLPPGVEAEILARMEIGENMANYLHNILPPRAEPKLLSSGADTRLLATKEKVEQAKRERYERQADQQIQDLDRDFTPQNLMTSLELFRQGVDNSLAALKTFEKGRVPSDYDPEAVSKAIAAFETARKTLIEAKDKLLQEGGILDQRSLILFRDASSSAINTIKNAMAEINYQANRAKRSAVEKGMIGVVDNPRIKGVGKSAGVELTNSLQRFVDENKSFLEGSEVQDVVYHGTVGDFIDISPNPTAKEPGAHFGTAKAADKFTALPVWLDTPGKGGNIRPSLINIKNPIVVDDVFGGGPRVLAEHLLEKGILLPEEMSKFRIKRVNDEGDARLMASLVETLKRKGYDGFKYKNRAEDVGSTSWVVFDKSQIKSATTNKVGRLVGSKGKTSTKFTSPTSTTTTTPTTPKSEPNHMANGAIKSVEVMAKTPVVVTSDGELQPLNKVLTNVQVLEGMGDDGGTMYRAVFLNTRGEVSYETVDSFTAELLQKQLERVGTDIVSQPIFKTSKGSIYTIHSDGTTTRDKSYHPEHGAEDVGIKPRSQQTFYVTEEGARKLGIIQAKGGGKMVVETRGDTHAAAKFLEGENKGKYAQTSLTEIKTKPEVGLIPVEIWNDGRNVHFGNKIVEIGSKGRSEGETAKIVADGQPSEIDMGLGRVEAQLKPNKESTSPPTRFTKSSPPKVGQRVWDHQSQSYGIVTKVNKGSAKLTLEKDAGGSEPITTTSDFNMISSEKPSSAGERPRIVGGRGEQGFISPDLLLGGVLIWQGAKLAKDIINRALQTHEGTILRNELGNTFIYKGRFLREASERAFRALLSTTKAGPLTRFLMKEVGEEVNNILSPIGKDFKWLVTELGQQDRLDGIDSWMGRQINYTQKLNDTDFILAWAGSRPDFDWRSNIEAFSKARPQDFPKSLATSIQTELRHAGDSGDFRAVRKLLGDTFTKAQTLVRNNRIMKEGGVSTYLTLPEVQEALSIYKKNIEAPLAEAFARTDGTRTERLGATDTYFPLLFDRNILKKLAKEGQDVPVKEGKERPRLFGGRNRGRAELQKPKTGAHYFATGLGEYTTELAAFQNNIRSALLAGDIANLYQILINEGVAKPLGTVRREDGSIGKEELLPGYIEVNAENYRVYRTMTDVGTITNPVTGRDNTVQRTTSYLPPVKRFQIPGRIYNELKPIFERGTSPTSIEADGLVNKLTEGSLIGFLEPAIHSWNIIKGLQEILPEVDVAMWSPSTRQGQAVKSIVNGLLSIPNPLALHPATATIPILAEISPKTLYTIGRLARSGAWSKDKAISKTQSDYVKYLGDIGSLSERTGQTTTRPEIANLTGAGLVGMRQYAWYRATERFFRRKVDDPNEPGIGVKARIEGKASGTIGGRLVGEGKNLLSTINFSPFITGWNGLDLRARLVAIDAIKKYAPTMPDSQVFDIVSTLGVYNKYMESKVGTFLKYNDIPIAPFYSAFSAATRVGINTWTGNYASKRLVGKDGEMGSKIASALSNSGYALLTIWALSYHNYTGKWPWDDEDSRLFEIPLNEKDASNWFYRATEPDPNKRRYISILGEHAAYRGATSLGIPAWYTTIARLMPLTDSETFLESQQENAMAAFTRGGTQSFNYFLRGGTSGPLLHTVPVLLTGAEIGLNVQPDPVGGGFEFKLYSPVAGAPFDDSQLLRRLWAAAEGLNGFGSSALSVLELSHDDHRKPENTITANFIKMVTGLTAPHFLRPQENPQATRLRFVQAEIQAIKNANRPRIVGDLVDQQEMERLKEELNELNKTKEKTKSK